METYGVQMQSDPSLLVRWARRAATKDFYPALAALASRVQNLFSSSHHTLSLYVCPHSPRNLGSQSCWVAFRLICDSGKDGNDDSLC
jgi:hypothetical protein